MTVNEVEGTSEFSAEYTDWCNRDAADFWNADAGFDEEAADVANFAMMIAQQAGDLDVTPTVVSSGPIAP